MFDVEEVGGADSAGVGLEITTRRRRERGREVFTGRKVASLSPEELECAHQAGYEPSDVDDWLIGRDPRAMTQAELRTMGHEVMSPMEAIRTKCLDCCAGSAHEVRCCVSIACPSWPFRTGKNPWRAPASEAQREASRRNAARMHAASSDTVKITGPSDETPTSVLG